MLSYFFLYAYVALAGAVVTYKIYHHRVEAIMKGEQRATGEFIVRRLDRELHPDASQLEQVRAIVEETHAEVEKVRRQFRPEIEEIVLHSQERIRALLRPDQREKYEQIIEKRKKMRENRENDR